VFQASSGTSVLEIVSELPASSDDPVRYLLQYRAFATALPIDPCHGEGAIPFDGRFTSNRLHVAQVGEISFGCGNAVAYKCAGRWGYIPSSADDPNADDMWDVHESCGHMASATYCMDHRSFTREGSKIELMDDWGVSSPTPPNMSPPRSWRLWMLPPNQWPPPPNVYYVEAGWFDEEKPFCLSRTRWVSMPPDPCPGVLEDPRVTAGARYCEEYTNDELATSGALMFNNSPTHDIQLHTWRDGTERVTTVRGFHDDFRVIPPRPGLTYESSGGILVRVPTTEFKLPGLLEEVRMYCDGPQCVVTTPATAPANHLDSGFEGYVFNDVPGRPSDTVAFKLYWNPVTGDYVSAIAKPTNAYQLQATIGYVLQ
jgi:hypothetical protein